jgi:hypothetical protein
VPPQVWLWDQLRRTAQRSGYFLGVSGGADSAAVASLVRLMAEMIAEAARGARGAAARAHVRAELARVAPLPLAEAAAEDGGALCAQLLQLSFMGSAYAAGHGVKPRDQPIGADAAGGTSYSRPAAVQAQLRRDAPPRRARRRAAGRVLHAR